MPLLILFIYPFIRIVPNKSKDEADRKTEDDHISVVPVAENAKKPQETLLTIEGTTEGDTDVDSLVTTNKV